MPRSYQELLVILFCVFSLFILGATFPARSQKEICTANLKNIYSMTISYQEDYGSLPPVITRVKPYWKFWYKNLRKYTESDLIFCCPADKRNAFMFKKQSPLFSTKQIKVPSYGMNYFLGGKPGALPFSLKKIKNPAQIILYGESKIPYMRPPQFIHKYAAFRHNHKLIIFLPTDMLKLSEKINY
jgi:hypothetical protein